MHLCKANYASYNDNYLDFFAELTDFKNRRIAHFRKNLVDLAELELKHAKVRINIVHMALMSLVNTCIKI